MLYNTTVPLYLGKFDKIIEENGYLANGKVINQLFKFKYNSLYLI